MNYHFQGQPSFLVVQGWGVVMKTKMSPNVSNKWLMPSTIGHLCCARLIWFGHMPGLQSWAAFPIINGFVTFWLLAKPQTHCGWVQRSKSMES